MNLDLWAKPLAAAIIFWGGVYLQLKTGDTGIGWAVLAIIFLNL